jgi:hypothetical protein
MCVQPLLWLLFDFFHKWILFHHLLLTQYDWEIHCHRNKAIVKTFVNRSAYQIQYVNAAIVNIVNLN